MKKSFAPAVMAVGGLAYVIAVTQRSSMGVAAIDATERFHTNAEQLSMLAVAQLVIYALMQVPVGILLDRFGPRVLLSLGAVSMALGQAAVAFATELEFAVVGRMLVGFGDAFTFISMIRLINGWYKGSIASKLQQWMGNGGQIGQILSAIPFAYLLHQTNWQSSFLTLASVSGVLAVAVFFVVADDRDHTSVHKPASFRTALSNLREQAKRPTTKMAFWIHFSTMSSSSMFLLLWGVPFLVTAQGLDKSVALGLLSSFVVLGFIAGVVYAEVCGRLPQLRHIVLVAMIWSILISWGIMLAWPGRAPFWSLILMVFCLGAAGPSSMIAFDYSKQFTPREKLGATNGFINIGGFSATFSMMFLIGLVLDGYYLLVGRVNGQQLYSVQGFRIAFVVLLLVVGFGLYRYSVNARLVRALPTSEVLQGSE